MQYKLSKSDWISIGKKTGWLKTAEFKWSPPLSDEELDELDPEWQEPGNADYIDFDKERKKAEERKEMSNFWDEETPEDFSVMSESQERGGWRQLRVLFKKGDYSYICELSVYIGIEYWDINDGPEITRAPGSKGTQEISERVYNNISKKVKDWVTKKLTDQEKNTPPLG